MQPFIAAQMRVEAGVELVARHLRFLVGALHLGDGQAALRRHRQHLGRIARRDRARCACGRRCRLWPSARCSSSSETTKPPPIE